MHVRYGLAAAERMFPAASSARAKVAGASPLDRWFRLRLTSRQDPRSIAANYARLAAVEQAQPNYLRRFAGVPDDSLYGQQWSLAEMGWDPGELEEAGAVVVAVVDSGLDYEHPDISPQVWTNAAEAKGAAGVDDDGNGYVDDVRGWDFSDAPGLPGEGDYLERDDDPRDESGHGTHVAGIIAAVVDNQLGIAGIAPGVRLMPLRAGFNLPGGGYLEDDDLAAAVVYAADNGAHVVNMSWGDPLFSPLIQDVIRHAARAGCVLVAAAGNEGNDQVFFPARLDETIAVAASAPGGQVASFSNWGYSIDLAAPGHRILSLAPGGGYGERSGTSMAAAHVSGLATLVLARSPHFTPLEVRGALALAARDAGPAGWDPWTGAGIVQAAAQSIDQPPVLQIVAPGSGEVLAESAVQVQVMLEGTMTCEVGWGAGNQPRSWHLLVKEEGGADGEVEARWNTSGLVEGTYQLRALGTGKGGYLEDRVAVEVRRKGPGVRDLRLFRALDGPDWAHLVEWRTEVSAGGVVFLERAGETVHQVPAVPGRRRQQVRLPGELDPGTYAVTVQAVAGPVAGTLAPAGDLVVEPRNAGWNLARLTRFPDGYLMPQIGDVDGDGRAELAQMPYGGRQYYNTGHFYRYEEAGPALAFASPWLFIPWNMHDLDGDDWAEIMAVDAQRVRLIEATRSRGFPDRIIWEQRDVWGGEGGDLDGDGRGDLLTGDGDGDVFVFENVADNAFRQVWAEAERGENVDARVVGGGADLDGDGRVEFAVARLIQEPFELRLTRWEVGEYQTIGDNAFAEEWQVEVLGGKAQGNGIAAADLDGDGLPELVLALVPDLYVFQAVDADEYAPVWHAWIRDTFRPAVGDLDGDGRTELVFNAENGVEAFFRTQPAEGLDAPAGFAAFPQDESRIVLAWEPVAGATGYRIFRDDQVREEHFRGHRFEDGGLDQGRIYRYSVAAVDSSTGREGPPSPTVAVQPETPPRVLAVERLSPHQLAVVFSTAMEISYLEPYRFCVEPGPGVPSSALPDRGGFRVVLSFDQALPDSGRFHLEVAAVRTRQGTPLADRRVDFVLQPREDPARPLGAEVLSPTRVALRFSREVVAPSNPAGVFSFSPPELRIRQVRVDGSRVVLELDEDTPLRPLGRRYQILISGLEDESGHRVEGVLVLRHAAASLAEVEAFPNPFFPARGRLTFGFLTPQAVVFIYDMAGRVLRVLEESNGDGGVQWDGTNEAGRPAESGVYFYKVISGTESRIGRFALIRE